MAGGGRGGVLSGFAIITIMRVCVRVCVCARAHTSVSAYNVIYVIIYVIYICYYLCYICYYICYL